MPKKRYQTSQAIQQKIRSERERATLLIAEHEEHKANAERMKKVPLPWGPEFYEDFAWECSQRDKKIKQAERIEKVVIPKLIAKIQEFNTNLLPCCGDDRSVPV